MPETKPLGRQPPKYAVGDWIRFRRNNQLLLDEIRYVTDSDDLASADWEYLTTYSGPITEDEVIEARRAALKYREDPTVSPDVTPSSESVS